MGSGADRGGRRALERPHAGQARDISTARRARAHLPAPASTREDVTGSLRRGTSAWTRREDEHRQARRRRPVSTESGISEGDDHVNRSRSRSSPCSSSRSRAARTRCRCRASRRRSMYDQTATHVRGPRGHDGAWDDTSDHGALSRLFGHTTSSPASAWVGRRHVGRQPARRVHRRFAHRAAGHRHQSALGRTLRGTTGFAGAAELGDQRVALVLDVGGAGRRSARRPRASD